MHILQTDAYRRAFVHYLRKGTPIHLSLKDIRASERYVWRTRRDEKVRPSHRRNDGRIFSWADAPATGHPGEDYNCRCEAVPYIAGQTEFAFHDFTTSLASSYNRWTDKDFLRHYYTGGGRPVTLLEIGHLREIAEQYAFNDGSEGAFRRLSDQIASVARRTGSHPIAYEFANVYNFENVEYSHGDATVSGVFSGVAEDRGAMLTIRGDTVFLFSDEFKDPLDIGVEPGGMPYPVTGKWTASFSAEVFKDEVRHDFFVDEGAH